MILRALRLAAIAALMLYSSPALAETYRVATEGAFPPFSDVDEEGRLVGFDVDIANVLCAAMNAECEIVAITWDDILPALARNEVDFVVASMAKTPEREEVADFTDHYYRSRTAYVAKTGRFQSVTPEAMRGLTLSTQRGTVQAEYLKQQFGAVATVRLTDVVDEAFTLLARGEVDVVLADSLAGFAFLKTPQGRDFDFTGEVLPADSPFSKAHIAVARGDEKLLESINDALRAIRLDGTYARINRRYFPFSIY